MISLLKKSENEKEVKQIDELKLIFQKSLRTLKHEMDKLLLGQTFETIEDKYSGVNKEENIENNYKVVVKKQEVV